MESYQPNLENNNEGGWNLKKFLIVLVVIIIVSIITVYIDYSKERNITQEIQDMFPSLSQDSIEKFISKAHDRNLTDEEVINWASELPAKGEVFLSDRQKEEMASLWWKAVGEIPEEQQEFIRRVSIKMAMGQQTTFEEDDLACIYVAKGFSLLDPKDKEKYLFLRGIALEEALKRE